MYASDPAYIVFGTYDGHCVVLDTRDPGFPVDIDSGRSEWFLLVGFPLVVDFPGVSGVVGCAEMSSRGGDLSGLGHSDE
jgi:hypothetical protein